MKYENGILEIFYINGDSEKFLVGEKLNDRYDAHRLGYIKFSTNKEISDTVLGITELSMDCARIPNKYYRLISKRDFVRVYDNDDWNFSLCSSISELTNDIKITDDDKIITKIPKKSIKKYTFKYLSDNYFETKMNSQDGIGKPVQEVCLEIRAKIKEMEKDLSEYNKSIPDKRSFLNIMTGGLFG